MGLAAILFFLPLTGCENPTGDSGNNSGNPNTEGGNNDTESGGETGGGGNDPWETGTPGPGVNNPGELGPVAFIAARGWRETFYVTWHTLAGAESFNVYFRGGAAMDWTRVDAPLIREYEGGFFRADVLGITAGTYEVKVVPVDSKGEASTNYATMIDIPVMAHVRTGFAFVGANHPGAYNMDGTPRDNAIIIYITNENKSTITVSIQDDTNRWEDAVGLQRILNRFVRGHERRPLIVRFVGKIHQDNFTLQQTTLRMLQLDSGVGSRINAPITLEGVGNDATAFGWGIRTNGAENVEIRNLGFMLGRHNADSIDIDGSRYVWIHHNDFFYNIAGGGDHEKGDGAVDISRSSHVTLSYNHFWDTGKTSLVGTQVGEAVGYITYHNNHFDHSDGRHPRVRAHQVHMFNNFFDHVAQYAIGAAGGSPSIFAEANYFRRTRNPMLISMQGSDIIGNDTFNGTGTFSSEDGGMIKAYNNFMCEWTLQHFRPWSPGNTEQFDAFVVQARNEEVPGTVVSRQGGHTFSNFDWNLGYTYTVRSPQDARDHVLHYAGRFWGGEIGTVIPFAFGPDDVGTARERRNPELDSILLGYKSRVIAIGMGGEANGDNENDAGNPVEPPMTEAPPVVDGVQTFNFSAPLFVNNLPANVSTEITIGGLIFTPGLSFGTLNAAQQANTGFTNFVGTGGNSNASGNSQRSVIIPLAGPARVTIFATTGNNTTTQTINIRAGRPTPTTWGAILATSPNLNTQAGVATSFTFTSNTVGSHELLLDSRGNNRIFQIKVEHLD